MAVSREWGIRVTLCSRTHTAAGMPDGHLKAQNENFVHIRRARKQIAQEVRAMVLKRAQEPWVYPKARRQDVEYILGQLADEITGRYGLGEEE